MFYIGSSKVLFVRHPLKDCHHHVEGAGKADVWEAENSDLQSEVDWAGIQYSGITNTQRSGRPKMTDKEEKHLCAGWG